MWGGSFREKSGKGQEREEGRLGGRPRRRGGKKRGRTERRGGKRWGGGGGGPGIRGENTLTQQGQEELAEWAP